MQIKQFHHQDLFFRSLSHPCAEDKAFFNLILRVSHALNLVPRAPRAFVTDFRYPCPAMLDYHRCSRKEPALLGK